MFFKDYPYLVNPWYTTTQEAKDRRSFLQLLDNFVNQKQYVKLTLLTWKERPIRSIEGEISNGSITKDGKSSVRTSCTLNAVVDAGTYNLVDLDADFSLNKKVYLEIGIKNETLDYPTYPILWFPQGIFIIKSCSCNISSTSALNLSINLRDKMSLLNGDAGGTLPATTIVDEMDTQLATGEIESKKIPIYQIIQEMVHHWGKEDLNNIVIEDVPLRIKRVMKWTGSFPLYLVSNGGSYENGTLTYAPQLEIPASSKGYIKVENGYDAGYVYDDFFYPDELSMPAGSTVVDVLEKIKSLLGNYEYFYDAFGIFHFREIKNYLNTTQATVLVDDMKMNDYLTDTTLPKSVYTFSDDTNLVSINKTPMYENIKNDYVVQGLRPGTSKDTSFPIYYHLAIDKKPEFGHYYPNVLLYVDPDTGYKVGIRPTIIYDSLPDIGDFNLIYYLDGKAYRWEGSEFKEVEIVKFYDSFNPYLTEDWRTELYMQGLVAQQNAIDTNYYWAELKAGWPTIFDLEKKQFIHEKEPTISQLPSAVPTENEIRLNALATGNWFLDFIDVNTPMGKYSVDAIGRRTNVTINEDINCLFEPKIPDVVFLNLDLYDTEPEKFLAQREECQNAGQPYAQTTGEVFAGFMTGGYRNAAYEQIKVDLMNHTTYQSTVSITALPVFYLEPNSRVTLNDKTTKTYGDFVISVITIPLSPGSTMTVSANEVLEKTI